MRMFRIMMTRYYRHGRLGGSCPSPKKSLPEKKSKTILEAVISAGAPPQTPLGELTALHQSPLAAFKGLLLKGGKGKGNRREERPRIQPPP